MKAANIRSFTGRIVALTLTVLATSGCGGGGALNPPVPVPVSHPSVESSSSIASFAGTQMTLSSGPTVTVRVPALANGLSAPKAIAYQSGTSGTWNKLSISPGGSTTIHAGVTGAYGVAWVCPANSKGTVGVELFQATAAENNTVIVQCGIHSYANNNGQIQGTVSESGFSTAADYNVSTTDGENYGLALSNGYKELALAIPGTQDEFAELTDSSGKILAFKTYQGLMVTKGNTITQNIQFKSSDAVGSGTLIVSGVNASATSLKSQVNYEFSVQGAVINDFVGGFGGRGANLVLGSGASATVHYATVASADVGINDIYRTDVVEGFGTSQQVETVAAAHSPPKSAVLPSFAYNPSVTASDNPSYSLSYSGYSSLTGGFKVFALLEALGPLSAPNLNIQAAITPGYVTARGSTTYALPNIAASGFPSLKASSGQTVTWIAEANYFAGTGFTASIAGRDYLDMALTSPEFNSISGFFDTADATGSFKAP